MLKIRFVTDTVFEEGQHNHYLRHDEQPQSAPSITGTPQLHPFWSAGFSFSRGHFVVNVPYDFYQPLIFQGEEMSIGVRGFTIGYDFYVGILLCVTLYTLFLVHLSQLPSLFPLATIPRLPKRVYVFITTREKVSQNSSLTIASLQVQVFSPCLGCWPSYI